MRPLSAARRNGARRGEAEGMGGEPAQKTEGGLSFERAHAVRQDLDALIYEAKSSASPAVEELKKVRRIFEAEFEKQGDAAAKAAGKDFLVPWKEAKKNFARLSAAEKGATDYAQREMTNRVLSPTDYGWGGVGALLGGILTGNPLGALAGSGLSLAHHVVRTEGNALAARALYAFDKGGLLGIEQAMKGTAQKLDTIPDVLGRMGKREDERRDRHAPDARLDGSDRVHERERRPAQGRYVRDRLRSAHQPCDRSPAHGRQDRRGDRPVCEGRAEDREPLRPEAREHRGLPAAGAAEEARGAEPLRAQGRMASLRCAARRVLAPRGDCARSVHRARAPRAPAARQARGGHAEGALP
jgi:hypothetical protein